MSSKKYIQDFYAQKAKQDGYSARSVYKFEAIHKKYLPNLHKANRILDIGAAPGSWTQYLQKHLKSNASIISVDLNPLTAKLLPQPEVTQIIADFTTPENIESLISQGPFDFVISDAAPLTTGNKSVDTARSEMLVETIAYIAQESLQPDGALVAKLFQGAGTQELLQSLRSNFKKILCYRPKAVKSSSFETYIIASSCTQ